MMRQFIKMHGLGNDFVIINYLDRHDFIMPSKPWIVDICNRRTGVGCDQLIILRSTSDADCEMLIFNSDGSAALACGNATRCVAKLLDKPEVTIKVGARILRAELLANGFVRVAMGRFSFNACDIPLIGDYKEGDRIKVMGIEGYAVSVGNPHFVVFVEDIKSVDLETIGPKLEHASIFPERANINFAQILNPAEIMLRVWERGAGETLACGSGACASAVVGRKFYELNKRIKVDLAGGDLWIEVLPSTILMEGPAQKVFEGEIIIKSV